MITNPSVAKVEYNEGMISRAVPQPNADSEAVGVFYSRQNGGAECTIDRTFLKHKVNNLQRGAKDEWV